MIITDIILLIAVNYFSGFILYKFFFKQTDIFEKIFLPQIFSLITTPALFTLLFFLVGFGSALIALPIISIILFLYSFKFKQKTDKFRPDKKIFTIIGIFLAILLLFFFLEFYDHAFSRITDSHFHASIINEIKETKNLPPTTACLSGEKLRYSWFPHIQTAIISIYTNQPAYSIFSIYGAYLFLLFGSSVYIISRHYFKNRTSTMLIFHLTIFVYFIPSFYIFSTQGYALPLIILTFYTSIKSVEDNSVKYKILTGLLVASLIYTHGLSFIFSSLMLLSIVAYNIQDLKNKITTPLYYIIPLILIIPFYFFSSADAGGLYMLQPFSGIFLFMAQLQFFNILVLLIPFALIKGLKTDDRPQVYLFTTLITVFLFMMLFIMPSNLNVSRNIILLMIPLSLFCVRYLNNSNKIIKFFVMVLVASSWINIHTIDIANTFSATKFSQLPEYSAATWIKSNSTPQDRILAAPTSMYAGVSERKPIICNEDFLRSWAYSPANLKTRFTDMLTLYKSPSRELIQKYNIKYIIFGDNEKKLLEKYDMQPFDFLGSSSFKSEYKVENYTVYSVQDLNTLPEKTSIQINLTSYSRWWEV